MHKNLHDCPVQFTISNNPINITTFYLKKTIAKNNTIQSDRQIIS